MQSFGDAEARRYDNQYKYKQDARMLIFAIIRSRGNR